MFRRLRQANLRHQPSDAAAVWGRYQVSGRQVVVTAKQSWQWVRLVLTIQPIHLHGRYGYLSFDEHTTSAVSPQFDDRSTVHFDVPEEPFRFVKDRRL